VANGFRRLQKGDLIDDGIIDELKIAVKEYMISINSPSSLQNLSGILVEKLYYENRLRDVLLPFRVRSNLDERKYSARFNSGVPVGIGTYSVLNTPSVIAGHRGSRLLIDL